MTDASRTAGWDAFISAAIAAATVAAYWPVRRAGFVNFDDPSYVTNNAIVQRGITWNGFKWALTTGSVSNWHPVTWLSHMLDCTLFGMDPTGPHLVNVGIHVVNAVLLFLLLRAMTGDRLPSALVAGMFALHPAHVESVAWISERKDVLSTLFWFLTTGAYFVWVRRPHVFGYAAVMILFAVGLMTKPMLVTLPFTLLLLDVWPLGRIRVPWNSSKGVSLAHAFREKVPLFGLAAASVVITFLAQHEGGAVKSLEQLSVGYRVGNALVSYARYLFILTWPSDLSVYYPLPISWPTTWIVGSSAVLVLGTVLGWMARRQRPYLLVGWLLFLGTLVPVLGLVQVGSQSIADRYTYVPSIGAFIMVAWTLKDVAGRLRRTGWACWVGAGIFVAAAGVGTHRQAGVWLDNERLFRHALSVSRLFNAHAHFEVGVELLNRGDSQGAREHFDAILAVAPFDGNGNSGLGTVLAREGNLDDAVVHFLRALEADPKLTDSRRSLAQILADQGRDEQAIQQFQRLLSYDPSDGVAHYRLGLLLAKRGEWKAAIDHLEEAVSARPSDFLSRRALIDGLTSRGRNEEAARNLLKLETLAKDAPQWLQIASRYEKLGLLEQSAKAYQKAVEIAPHDATAAAQFGTFLSSHGHPDPGSRYLRKALSLNPDDITARMNLAMAELASGRADEAIKQFNAACSAQPTDPKLPFRAGSALAHQGRTAEAAFFLLAAGEKDPSFVGQTVALLQTLIRAGKHATAMALVRELQQHAERQKEQGKADEAAKLLTEIQPVVRELANFPPKPEKLP